MTDWLIAGDRPDDASLGSIGLNGSTGCYERAHEYHF